MDKETISLLEWGAEALHISLSPQAFRTLFLYIDELQRWSQVFNLVGRHDAKTIIRKHILDSLAFSHILPWQGVFADLGSGAGFPGFLLAVAGPEREVFLIEARRKRANFLKQATRKTGVENIRVFEGRAEEFAQQDRRPTWFDTVVTRATWDIAHFLSLSFPIVKEGGYAVAMRGPHKNGGGAAGENHPSHGGFTQKALGEYRLPFGEGDRYALFFRKKCFT
ncbi:MAG: 16S rRNA (guanine(527)-N(7))-methyltransferase RsmG [Desulfurellaceae bacterium]|nr:16S rRNA (guanine(527)-N(7))-methyltransferase RsmG [Desulfurellaceae bacterium]